MKQPAIATSCHISPTSIEHASRMLKMTKTLTKRGLVGSILIVAMAKKNLPKWQRLDEKREVVGVSARLNGRHFIIRSMRFIEWSLKVIWQLRTSKLDMVNCHTLSVLPLCVILKFLHKATLVYEPHELETETFTSKGLRKRFSKLLERFLIQYVDSLIVVSQSIAEHYQRDYQLSDVKVILNVPELKDEDPLVSKKRLRTSFNIPDAHLVFMYQGVLDDGRGIEWLLEAFQLVPLECHLVLMGFGPQEETIRSVIAKLPNIHFQPAVAPQDLLQYTQGADVGFALLTDDCLNHQYALPNKFFHYLQAGLPVIVSDLGEMGRLVNQYQLGWQVSNTVKSLVECERMSL